MDLIKKLFQRMLAFMLICAAGIGAFIGYENYQKYQRDKAELAFMVDEPWQWQDKYYRIQKREIKGKNTFRLRKVYLDEERVMIVLKEEDYTVTKVAVFKRDCDPNSEITTTKNWSDGSPKILKCSPDGDALYFGAHWKRRNNDIVWEENLDGFRFREDFKDWDFNYLDQLITLSQSKPLEEVTQQ